MNKLLMACLSLLMILLAACGSGPSQTTSEPAPATEAEAQPTAPPQPTDTATTAPATDAPVAGPTEAPIAGISFTNQVMPIFQTSCIECHGGRQVKEGLDLQTYEAIIAGSLNGPVVVPGSASESLLVQLVVEGEMPKRSPKLTAEQIQVISEWINQGAQDN